MTGNRKFKWHRFRLIGYFLHFFLKENVDFFSKNETRKHSKNCFWLHDHSAYYTDASLIIV